MKRILILALAVALITPTGASFAERFSPMQGGRCSASWSSLSMAQKEKLQTLQRRFLEEVAPIQGSFYARHLELKALWSDPKATPAALEAKEREAFDLLRQIQEKALRYRLEARSLLGPDQISQFHGGFWLFRGPGMGGGRGSWMGWRGGAGWGCWGSPDE